MNIEFTQINNDTNGNPRHVCHFLNFVKDSESLPLDQKYSIALYRAKKLGGRKFHNKQYGGGIVFQTFNTADLNRKINDLLKTI